MTLSSVGPVSKTWKTLACAGAVYTLAIEETTHMTTFDMKLNAMAAMIFRRNHAKLANEIEQRIRFGATFDTIQALVQDLELTNIERDADIVPSAIRHFFDDHNRKEALVVAQTDKRLLTTRAIDARLFYLSQTYEEASVFKTRRFSTLGHISRTHQPPSPNEYWTVSNGLSFFNFGTLEVEEMNWADDPHGNGVNGHWMILLKENIIL